MTAPLRAAIEDPPSYPPVVPPRPGRKVVLKYLDGRGPRGGKLAIRAVLRPKVGGFRLYEWSDLGRTRLVCRACRARIKPESQGRHLVTELRRHGSEEALAARLALRSAQRRSKKNLRKARYNYALGVSKDWQDRERLEGSRP